MMTGNQNMSDEDVESIDYAQGRLAMDQRELRNKYNQLNQKLDGN